METELDSPEASNTKVDIEINPEDEGIREAALQLLAQEFSPKDIDGFIQKTESDLQTDLVEVANNDDKRRGARLYVAIEEGEVIGASISKVYDWGIIKDQLYMEESRKNSQTIVSLQSLGDLVLPEIEGEEPDLVGEFAYSVVKEDKRNQGIGKSLFDARMMHMQELQDNGSDLIAITLIRSSEQSAEAGREMFGKLIEAERKVNGEYQEGPRKGQAIIEGTSFFLKDRSGEIILEQLDTEEKQKVTQSQLSEVHPHSVSVYGHARSHGMQFRGGLFRNYSQLFVKRLEDSN